MQQRARAFHLCARIFVRTVPRELAALAAATFLVFGSGAFTPASAQTSTPKSSVAAPSAMQARVYVPHRVFDSRKKKWIDFETLAERANASDIVFVGEQHND